MSIDTRPAASWLCAAVVALFFVRGTSSAQSIFTIAGGGSDEGRPATAAALGNPRALAFDAAGNLFVASSLTNRIRRIDAETGIIRTVAGSGSQDFGGDGGPATEASLYSPWGVVVARDGDLVIADSWNHRIRRVDGRTWIITTIAGTGDSGFGGDGGPATRAFMQYPRSLAMDDSGNLFVADQINGRIRRIDAISGSITTVAGDGGRLYGGDDGPATLATLGNPYGVALDTAGDILIADTSNNRVRRVDRLTGLIETIAGVGDAGFGGDGGPATLATLNEPSGVAVDADGNLIIADTANHRVRRVDALTGTITTVTGNGEWGFDGDGGPATEASLYRPLAVMVDSQRSIYVSDSGNERVRKVDASGTISTIAGNGDPTFGGDGGPATLSSLDQPRGLVFDSSGNLFIADTGAKRVRQVGSEDGLIETIASMAVVRVDTAAWDVALHGDDLYIADAFFHKIRRLHLPSATIATIAGNGLKGFGGDGGPATDARLNAPESVEVDANGNVVIADTGNHRVRRVDRSTGAITTVAGTGSAGFGGDGGPATAAVLDDPMDVAFDLDGNLYVADAGNARVRRVGAGDGIITTIAGNGVHGADGDGGPATEAAIAALCVAVDDEGNVHVGGIGRVWRIDRSTGIITTVAGPGFGGDGGAATEASLIGPYGIAFDPEGNLGIADTGHNRIRIVPRCVDLSPVSLSTPADGASGVRPSTTLGWQPVPGAFRYDVYFDDVDPPVRIIAADTERATFSVPDLEPLTTYYWRVVAKGDPFCEPARVVESAVWSFTTTTSCDVSSGLE